MKITTNQPWNGWLGWLPGAPRLLPGKSMKILKKSNRIYTNPTRILPESYQNPTRILLESYQNLIKINKIFGGPG